MTLCWVIGSTGLLGSAIVRALRRKGAALFVPAQRLSWSEQGELKEQLAVAVDEFAARVGGAERWELYWAAGVGTMGSSARDLKLETQTLAQLIGLVEANPVLGAKPGAVAFSSSAGAIYAGSRDAVISEHSPVAPTTPYANAKLAQEELLRCFAQRRDRMTALLARISTIYGPKQAKGKQQGLVAHIARCMVRNSPIQIYVPFDTIRDYLCVDDAAEAMVANLRVRDNKLPVRVKIIAAEKPTTIAEIVSVFKTIARRSPRVVTSASQLGELYSRRIQFQSVQFLDAGSAYQTPLLIGIAEVLAAERAEFARGSRFKGQ